MPERNFPRVGETFEGRYRIEAVIGAGGFSRVFRALQTDLERLVAIKVLDPELHGRGRGQQDVEAKLQVIAKRFDREAKLVSNLRDSHTVTMYDYGRTEDGLLFMVLEFVDGLTINELVERDGPINPQRVVKILRQALTSLEEAHALGVLHRDIKPANIMVYEHVGRQDQVKVLDFGIAKSVSDSTRKVTMELTGDGMLIGTPRYMSPEQIRGEVELGPPSDIYALGLVAYEMLIGKHAVDADSGVKIIAKHLDPESIRVPLWEGIPGATREIVDAMLRKDYQTRFQSAQEILEALEYWNAETLPLDVNATIPVPASLPTIAPGLLIAEGVGDTPSGFSVPPTMTAVAEAPSRKTEPSAPKFSTNALLVGILVLLLMASGGVVYNIFFADSGAATPPAEDQLVADPSTNPTIRAVEAALVADDPSPEPPAKFVESGADEERPEPAEVEPADAGEAAEVENVGLQGEDAGVTEEAEAAVEEKQAAPATRRRRAPRKPITKEPSEPEESVTQPTKFVPTKKKTSGGLIPLDRMQ